MNRQRLFIASEIRELEGLLAAIPKENVIERTSLEARLENAKNILDTLPQTGEGPKARLTFRGKPVFESHGISAVSRPLDPLVMRFINKEELMTGNEDLTVQFGEDPPWDDLPPVDREKANKELESRLIFDSWTCRFCGGTFADRTLAIKHAIDCDDNEDVHSCATCASYEIGEDTRDGYRHICKGNPIDTWMKHCPEWIGA